MSHAPNYRHCGYLGPHLELDQIRQVVRQAVEALSQEEFDAIAFSGMSGALIAPIIAFKLGKTLILVRKEGDQNHSGQLVEGDAGARTYVIVDDFVSTGETVQRIVESIGLYFSDEAECVGVYRTSHGSITYNLKPVMRAKLTIEKRRKAREHERVDYLTSRYPEVGKAFSGVLETVRAFEDGMLFCCAPEQELGIVQKTTRILRAAAETCIYLRREQA